MQANAAFATTTRTVPLEGDDALRAAIADLEVRLDKHGRSMADIDFMAWSEPRTGLSPDAYVNRLSELGELGATWSSVGLDTSSFPAVLDDLRAWGEVVRQL